MTDKMRYRSGNTNPVDAAVDAATVIEIGDPLWQDVDDAKPASEISKPDQEYCNASFSELMRECFADNFLGVAMQRSVSGHPDPVRVSTTGVFEFDVDPPETFELGDLVGADAADPSDDYVGLLNQQVGKVTASKYAIGRVAKRAATPVASVLVDIRSKVMGYSL